jgi:hypothetical protein
MQHAVFQPVRLPDPVWSSADTQELLRERRVGQLFLLAKKYAGASQARIAAATGLNQGEVSRIQRGDRWVTAIDVLERIADGFAMPDPARILLGLAPVGVIRPRVVPEQLPPAVSGFAGRSAELAWLKDQSGCVVVSGPGGMGKSALAVAWAHQADFPDGRLYVDMRDTDPEDALAGLLRALGAQVPPTLRERTAEFRSLLAGRHMLVLLDDAVSADQVRPLLPGSPGCMVVVTSREPLGDLVVREGAIPLRLGPLPEDEALDLVTRVAGRRRVEADPAMAAAVVEESGRVPLALRAAAVRLGQEERRPAKVRWPVVAATVGVGALAVVAGVAGLSDVVDRVTLHAVVATRGGQLAVLGLLVLAGCAALLAPVARLRPPVAAGCLLGIGCTTVVATVGRAPFGPPALVDTVRLTGAAVWVAVLLVTVVVVRNVAGYAICVPFAAAGSWLIVARLVGDGTATTQTYGRLLVAGSALVIAVLGMSTVRARRPRTGGRTVPKPVIAAVAVLLATSVLASIPGPPARHRAYASVVYGRHIESHPVLAQSGSEPASLTVEAECATSPCSSSPAWQP